MIEKYHAYAGDAHHVSRAFNYDRKIDLLIHIGRRDKIVLDNTICTRIMRDVESMNDTKGYIGHRHVMTCIIDNITTVDISIIIEFMNDSYDVYYNYRIAEAMEKHCPDKLCTVIDSVDRGCLTAYRNYHRGYKYGRGDMY